MEDVKYYYYNDQATLNDPDPVNGNCTYGMGHLVHIGPCGHELNKPVSKKQVIDNMRKDVANAEDTVKKLVTRIKLTQAKFDALVCHVFNNGTTPVLFSVNQGTNDEAMINELLQYDKAYNNQTKRKEFEGGILKRSEWEAVAFGYKGPFYKKLNPPTPTWG